MFLYFFFFYLQVTESRNCFFSNADMLSSSCGLEKRKKKNKTVQKNNMFSVYQKTKAKTIRQN